MASKEIVSKTNIGKYFDSKPIGFSQLKPGMLVSFDYQSPDREIHDHHPLVYVLERKGDRAYGLNLHYKFSLAMGLIEAKRTELEKKTDYKKLSNQPVQKPSSNSDKSDPKKKEAIPTQRQTVNKKKIPLQLLEIFELPVEPAAILRNYLPNRMTKLTKMIFKV